MKVFGFEIEKPVDQIIDREKEQRTFALPENTDGAINISGAGFFGTFVDLDGTFRNEAALITKYREMSIQPEMERAIDEITNEAIIFDESGKAIELNTDNLNQPEVIKQRIQAEFDYLLKLMNFGQMGYEIFRRWYIDGRLFYHIVIDEKNTQEGIQEIRYIDPRRIRKIREIQKMRDPQTGIELIKKQVEYYLYNERGILGGSTNMGAKIAPDAIVNINSGIMDPKQSMVLSYLHQAIKPFNNLRMVEDAVVIYRLSRAPERRIFYIDVGNMPSVKAEQYVRDIMVKYRNKLVYDSNTGEIKDDRRHLSMLEDFWLPRREGSKGTEIDTLPPGQNLGQMEDVKYFEQKLYKALHVPISRLEQNNGFSLGRSAEISRDEVNFSMFIARLRTKFSTLFDDLLRVQLVLKKVCTEEEWKQFKEDIWYNYKKDVVFAELRDAEILTNRLNMLPLVQPFEGTYFSREWIRKNVLKQTDEEIEQIDLQNQQENEIRAQEQQAAFDQQLQQQSAVNMQNAQDQAAAQDMLAPSPEEQQQQSVETDKTRKHEAEMTDKKMEAEKLKAKTTLAKAKIDAKKVATKPPAKKSDTKKKVATKKKSVKEEADSLNLVYIGYGQYANESGKVTHIVENSTLIPID